VDHEFRGDDLRGLARRAPPARRRLAFTDSIAFGVLHVLAARGVRVPDQVSVIGFDDVDGAAYAIPSLSTVSFDRRAFATAALDLLTRRIADRGAAPETVVVPHRIVERASVADRPR
jgi:DNA-binding LacI/PurR family transcriptional regulator